MDTMDKAGNGQIIRSYRERAGLTRTQLADKLLMSEIHLKMIENHERRPSIHVLAFIGLALKIPDRELESIADGYGYYEIVRLKQFGDRGYTLLSKGFRTDG